MDTHTPQEPSNNTSEIFSEKSSEISSQASYVSSRTKSSENPGPGNGSEFSTETSSIDSSETSSKSSRNESRNAESSTEILSNDSPETSLKSSRNESGNAESSTEILSNDTSETSSSKSSRNESGNTAEKSTEIPTGILSEIQENPSTNSVNGNVTIDGEAESREASDEVSATPVDAIRLNQNLQVGHRIFHLPEEWMKEIERFSIKESWEQRLRQLDEPVLHVCRDPREFEILMEIREKGESSVPDCPKEMQELLQASKTYEWREVTQTIQKSIEERQSFLEKNAQFDYVAFRTKSQCSRVLKDKLLNGENKLSRLFLQNKNRDTLGFVYIDDDVKNLQRCADWLNEGNLKFGMMTKQKIEETRDDASKLQIEDLRRNAHDALKKIENESNVDRFIAGITSSDEEDSRSSSGKESGTPNLNKKKKKNDSPRKIAKSKKDRRIEMMNGNTNNLKKKENDKKTSVGVSKAAFGMPKTTVGKSTTTTVIVHNEKFTFPPPTKSRFPVVWKRMVESFEKVSDGVYRTNVAPTTFRIIRKFMIKDKLEDNLKLDQMEELLAQSIVYQFNKLSRACVSRIIQMKKESNTLLTDFEIQNSSEIHKYFDDRWSQDTSDWETFRDFCKQFGIVMLFMDFLFYLKQFEQNGTLVVDRRKLQIVPKLDGIPSKVIQKIINRLEWFERLAVRKTCRTLRKEVDSSLVEIRMFNFNLNAEKATIQLDNDLNIEYMKCDEGCMILFRGKQKLLKDGNHFFKAMEDLRTILRNPNITFHLFQFEFMECVDERFKKMVASKLNSFFQSIGHGIKVRTCIIKSILESEPLAIIKVLQPHEIEKIEVINSNPFNLEKPILNFKGIAETGAWIYAKSFKTDFVAIGLQLNDLQHFEEVDLKLESLQKKEFLCLLSHFEESHSFKHAILTLDVEFREKIPTTLGDNMRIDVEGDGKVIVVYKYYVTSV